MPQNFFLNQYFTSLNCRLERVSWFAIFVQCVPVNTALKQLVKEELAVNKAWPLVETKYGCSRIYTKPCEVCSLSQHPSTLRKPKKKMGEDDDDKRGQRKTEVDYSMCINLLFITAHKEDASIHWRNKSEKWPSAPHYSFLSGKSTIHSWDVPHPRPSGLPLVSLTRWTAVTFKDSERELMWGILEWTTPENGGRAKLLLRANEMIFMVTTSCSLTH